MNDINVGRLEVKFECSDCGPVEVIVPDEDDATEWILCATCDRALITVDELNEQTRMIAPDIIRAKLFGRPDTAQFTHPRLKRG